MMEATTHHRAKEHNIRTRTAVYTEPLFILH